MGYVVHTCARLKHGLAVLTFQPEEEGRALLKPYAGALAEAGIGCSWWRYLRAHPKVASLARRETGCLGRSFLNGAQRKSALPVPVALVEFQQDAAIQPIPAQDSATADKASVA